MSTLSAEKKRHSYNCEDMARHIGGFACECYAPPKSILVLQSSVVNRSDFLQRAKNREDISHPITPPPSPFHKLPATKPSLPHSSVLTQAFLTQTCPLHVPPSPFNAFRRCPSSILWETSRLSGASLKETQVFLLFLFFAG